MELVLIRHALPRRVAAVEAIIAAHSGELVAAVCHGGVINASIAHVLGRAGSRAVMTLNETPHFRGSGLPIGLFDRG